MCTWSQKQTGRDHVGMLCPCHDDPCVDLSIAGGVDHGGMALATWRVPERYTLSIKHGKRKSPMNGGFKSLVHFPLPCLITGGYLVISFSFTMEDLDLLVIQSWFDGDLPSGKLTWLWMTMENHHVQWRQSTVNCHFTIAVELPEGKSRPKNRPSPIPQSGPSKSKDSKGPKTGPLCDAWSLNHGFVWWKS